MGRSRDTIVEAIRHVLRDAARPLGPREIHAAIVARGLYTFHADDPVGVVRAQIRRRCEGLDFPSAYPIKVFRQVEPGAYALLETPHAEPSSIPDRPGHSTLMELRAQLEAHRDAVRARLADHLRSLSPTAFEQFSGRLLRAYGFEDVVVTSVSGDGGLDGHGRLRVGLARLKVAFQCKRWKGRVHRPEIDRFRGAVQGDYEQGVFFTTSSFSAGAIEVSIKRGAAPIILVDMDGVLDLMFACGLGVTFEAVNLPSIDLDTLLAE